MSGKLRTFSIATAFSVGILSPVYAAAAEVNDFNGQWGKSTTAGGTADIVDLTGQGGNLENNAPLPTGVLKMTTTVNEDKVDVSRSLGNTTVSDIFNNDIRFSYSLFKEDTADDFSAPALKLGFFNQAVSDAGNDGFVQLIFEPTWNISGFEGSSSAVPTGDWLTFDIGFDNGLFWNTGGFGQNNSGGGPPLNTLSGWLGDFDQEFEDASLIGLGVGQGSFNPNTVAYVDDVNASFNNQQVASADFEVAQVPTPATLLLLISGLLGLGAIHRLRVVH